MNVCQLNLCRLSAHNRLKALSCNILTWLFPKKSLQMGRVMRIWYLSPMRAAKVQASLRIRAVSPEPSLLAHTSSESRRTFRQKTRSLAPLNGWTCAVEICHDGMLEDTYSLDGAQIINPRCLCLNTSLTCVSHIKRWGWYNLILFLVTAIPLVWGH